MNTPFRLGKIRNGLWNGHTVSTRRRVMERIPGQEIMALQTSAHVTRLMEEDRRKDRFNRDLNCDYTPLGYVSGSWALTRNVCSGRTG
ncbi:hypothetical protein Areg01_14460 [Actinoplanes regularis]|nr:hypothetical protein Areg01_14460 [Actinoplanes regularis]